VFHPAENERKFSVTKNTNMFFNKELILNIINRFKKMGGREAPSQSDLFTEPLAVNDPSVRIPRPEHIVSRRQISKSALTVLYELQRAGYRAFLVGGSVRDILLNHQPKDFDVATNALPAQVKEVFGRRCRLIGRRFLLAHVHLNREIIEVATFRAHHDKGGGGVMKGNRILRDNVYGTIDEDAARRDFTVNALYYDINDFSILDYTGGINDLRERTLRLIGEPELRYQEDPVRMLRAARFAAKLTFDLEASTAEPIYKLGHLLREVHTARLYEEVVKLFFTGHAVASFEQLRQFDLFKQLFPQTEACLDSPIAFALIKQALSKTDKRIRENKPVTQGFLLAILLWCPVMRLLNDGTEDFNQSMLVKATHQVLDAQNTYMAIPRRVTGLMEEIWLLQPRLTPNKIKKRNLKVMEHPYFRAGYDFLMLRAESGEPVGKWVEQWKRLQSGESANEIIVRTKKPRYRRSRGPVNN
jgi:poly(A) polymerase